MKSHRSCPRWLFAYASPPDGRFMMSSMLPFYHLLEKLRNTAPISSILHRTSSAEKKNTKSTPSWRIADLGTEDSTWCHGKAMRPLKILGNRKGTYGIPLWNSSITKGDIRATSPSIANHGLRLCLPLCNRTPRPLSCRPPFLHVAFFPIRPPPIDHAPRFWNPRSHQGYSPI